MCSASSRWLLLCCKWLLSPGVQSTQWSLSQILLLSGIVLCHEARLLMQLCKQNPRVITKCGAAYSCRFTIVPAILLKVSLSLVWATYMTKPARMMQSITVKIWYLSRK
jgi:hypothetical protein